jgi:flagellar basal body rod protein FlgG
MMAFGEMFNTLNSYRALDNWVQSMSTSVAGAGKVGFKSAKSTFLGGGITQFQQTQTRPPVRIGEQTLYSETTIDWSQGELVDTGSPNQFAVKGEGFFLLMDEDKKFYYSRGGNFTLRDGKLKTPEGLVVVDKAMLQTLSRQAGITLPSTTNLVAGVAANTYNGAALTDTDLFTATSGWVKPTAAPVGGMWLPFVNTALSQKSSYFEDLSAAAGDESYKSQDVAFRTSFHIDKSNTVTAGQLTVSVNNAAYVWVNGKQLATSDLAATVVSPTNLWGGYPVVGGPTLNPVAAGGVNNGTASNTSTFNIAPYLQSGVNTIEILGSEWENENGSAANNETLITGGSITLASGPAISLASAGGTASLWSSKLIGPNTDAAYYDYTTQPDPTTPVGYDTHPWLSRVPSAPSQTYEDRMFNSEARDFLLVNFQYKDGLRFSKYGNTIYEAGGQVGNITINEQNQNGAGRVLAGKLESSNVDFDNISSEMKLAEHMYDGLANVLEARYSLLDTMFQMLLP